MLITFTVGNYRSIKDPVTLSMVCSRIKELPANIIETKRKGLKLLKTAVIYGANASGKSNVLKAMEFMGNFIKTCLDDTLKNKEIPVDEFIFNTETVGKPSYFEIIFLIDEMIYRYGFEVDRKRIHSEWLFSNLKGKDRMLFFRDENNIKVGNFFKEGKGLEDKTRDNALFLSVCAQFNGKVSLDILNWFMGSTVMMGMDDIAILQLTLELLKYADYKNEILKFISLADLQIVDIKTNANLILLINKILKDKDKNINDTLDKILKETTTTHFQYDKELNKIGNVDLNLFNESEGTKKFLAFIFFLVSLTE
ncbi:MAG: ATP-binding protein, partial [Nitrospirae bacterium]|nr:ATP-binding protein [Nitrospirota bacterium]